MSGDDGDRPRRMDFRIVMRVERIDDPALQMHLIA